MKNKKIAVMTAMALVCGLALAPLAWAQSADELAKAISEAHVNALKQVTELMKDRPEPKDLAPKVEALREETIKKMVEFGKKVQALDAAGQKKTEAKVAMSFSSVPGDMYKAYSEGQMFYQKKDAALGKQIKDFNIITQYAFYELLKKQEPKEAERLGIK